MDSDIVRDPNTFATYLITTHISLQTCIVFTRYYLVYLQYMLLISGLVIDLMYVYRVGKYHRPYYMIKTIWINYFL